MILKKLDYILIPTGWGRKRKKRAIQELEQRQIDNILILNGKNSEENILYLGRKLKQGERVGFVTFPLHYQEYKEIIKKAQKQKKFPQRIKTENIATKETFKEFIYGLFGLMDEQLNNNIDYLKNKPRNKFKDKLRQFIRKILK